MATAKKATAKKSPAKKAPAKKRVPQLDLAKVARVAVVVWRRQVRERDRAHDDVPVRVEPREHVAAVGRRVEVVREKVGVEVKRLDSIEGLRCIGNPLGT